MRTTTSRTISRCRCTLSYPALSALRGDDERVDELEQAAVKKTPHCQANRDEDGDPQHEFQDGCIWCGADAHDWFSRS